MSSSAVLGKLDHVAIAVWSMRDAARLVVDVMGGRFIGGGDNPELRVKAAQFDFEPGFKIELLEPLGEDSYLAAYLHKHGEGFHHITAYVEDVEAAAAELTEAGFGVIDTDVARESWKETFIRPSEASGTLIQLAKPGTPWTEAPEWVTLERVLDGEIQVLANEMSLKADSDLWD